jgi:hypothetical protein
MLKLWVVALVLTSVTRLTLDALATVTGMTVPMSTQPGAEAMTGRGARCPPAAKKYGG